MKKGSVKRLVLTAMMMAVAIVLAIVEGFLPPAGVPGVKLGLANIVVMAALLLIGRGEALAIVAAKAVFVLITRGVVAGLLSLSGGLCSVLCMMLLLALSKNASILLVSIIGAVVHNLAQLAVVTAMLSGSWLWVYTPVLLVAGILAGSVTAYLVKCLLPLLKGVVHEKGT